MIDFFKYAFAGLLCVTAIVAEPTVAKAPELKISGFTIVTAATSSQTIKANGKGGTDPHMQIGASDLMFTIEGMTPTGFGYRYRINFETFSGADFHVNKNYIEFNDTGFGTLQFGNLTGPEDTMIDSGAFLVGGAAGIDGGLNGIFNFSSGVQSGANYLAQTKRATKAVWYSPKVSGIQIGLAFTPNTSHGGQSAKNNSKVILGDMEKGNDAAIYPDKERRPFGAANWTGGVTYGQSWDKWSFTVAAVGTIEKTKYRDPILGAWIPMNTSKSYQLSAVLGYGAWEFGAGWIDSGKSRLPKGDLLKDYIGEAHLGNSGTAWNVGASYTFGPYQVAAVYHRTDRKNTGTERTNSDIWVTTLDFSALQGLKFFGELDYIQMRTNKAAMDVDSTYYVTSGKEKKEAKEAISDNSGVVLLVGTKMSF